MPKRLYIALLSLASKEVGNGYTTLDHKIHKLGIYIYTRGSAVDLIKSIHIPTLGWEGQWDSGTVQWDIRDVSGMSPIFL